MARDRWRVIDGVRDSHPVSSRGMYKQSARWMPCVVLAVSVGAASACSAFGGNDSSVGGGQGTDGSATDAAARASDGGEPATESGSTDPAVDAGDVLADGLENASPGDTCAPPYWTCANCTTKVVTGLAHSGAHSCQVCRVGSSSSIYLITPIPGPGAYTFQAWIMALPDAGVFAADAGAPHVESSGFSAHGPTTLDPLSYNDATLMPGQWRVTQSVGAVGADGGPERLVANLAEFPPVLDDCFYVDDVRIYRR